MRKILLLFATCTLLTACSDTNSDSGSATATEAQFVQANLETSKAESVASDGFAQIMRWESSTLTTLSDEYKTVVVTVTGKSHGMVYPKKITITYKGVADEYGIVRAGKITGELDSAIWKEGSKLTLNYGGDYSVNGIKFSGTQVFVTKKANVTPTTITNIEFESSIKNGSLQEKVGNETKLATWSAERTWLWSPLQTTITGVSNGKTSNGLTYDSKITQELVKTPDCRYITSGIAEIYAAGDTATIDFQFVDGRGTCNPYAYFTYKGYKKEVKLEY